MKQENSREPGPERRTAPIRSSGRDAPGTVPAFPRGR